MCIVHNAAVDALVTNYWLIWRYTVHVHTGTGTVYIKELPSCYMPVGCIITLIRMRGSNRRGVVPHAVVTKVRHSLTVTGYFSAITLSTGPAKE